MKKTARIILVRHGESLNNKQGIIGGDSHLTEKGKLEAEETKKVLAGIRFDSVYSSDLGRAIETAQIISGHKVSSNNRLVSLRERNFGALEGKSSKYHAEEHQQRMSMTHEEIRHYKHVSDEENDHELSSRFIGALQNIAEHSYGKTVLIAAHGAAIRTILMDLLGLTYHDLPQGSFKNAGYVELEFKTGNFKIIKVVRD